jgi:hypothetical protein
MIQPAASSWQAIRATAAELHRQFRMVIDSQWYAAVFPELRLAKETDSNSSLPKGATDMRLRLAEHLPDEAPI